MATDAGSGTFGSVLLRYRLAAGLSQEELAERAGLSRRGISDLERGARRTPHPATVRRLVEALNLDQAERAALLTSAHAALNADTPTATSSGGGAETTGQLVGPQPTETTTESVAELLRRYRLNAGLTQNALADRAGISGRAVSDLERGMRRFPYPDTLQRLADALGVGDVERALLQSAAARLDGRAQLQSSPRAALAHNLPVQLTSFVGRAQDIADICREVEHTRLLTLAGPGGVGKTRLVLQVAEAKLGIFRDGVWFVELAPLSEPALVPHTIANALNVPEKPEESITTSLLKALQPLQLLLILDNCEHLLTACVELIDRLLRACPDLVVLTTSREVLGLGAETVWRVRALRVNSADVARELEQSTESEAAELFIERARAIQTGFAMTPDNASAIQDICQRLDGIPLAIELAASRVGVFGLEHLAERLASDARLLISKDRTVASRQQTLENAIQWSYELLTREEQFVFDRLSVFAGGWTLEAMEAVVGNNDLAVELLVALEHLVDKSLVQVDDAAGHARRYWLLEPLRQFACNRLEQRGEVATIHERHAAFFLEVFEQAEQEFLLQFATPGLLNRMDRDIGNLRVALRWLIGQSDAERAQRLSGAARTLWLQRAYLEEGRRWLEEALALDPPAGSQNEPAARARALLGLLGIALHAGDLAGAETAGQASLHLLEELHDTARAAGALRFLGLVADARADLARARSIMEQALAASRETGQLAPGP
jgi:predicted ATPase/transcriptional regulator with XRE-family HTH domain